MYKQETLKTWDQSQHCRPPPASQRALVYPPFPVRPQPPAAVYMHGFNYALGFHEVPKGVSGGFGRGPSYPKSQTQDLLSSKQSYGPRQNWITSLKWTKSAYTYSPDTRVWISLFHGALIRTLLLGVFAIPSRRRRISFVITIDALEELRLLSLKYNISIEFLLYIYYWPWKSCTGACQLWRFPQSGPQVVQHYVGLRTFILGQLSHIDSPDIHMLSHVGHDKPRTITICPICSRWQYWVPRTAFQNAESHNWSSWKCIVALTHR